MTPLMNQELWEQGNDRKAMLENLDNEVSRILKSYQFEPQLIHYEYYEEFTRQNQ